MTLDQYVLELHTRASMIAELQEAIGQRVLVGNDLNDPWMGPFKLTSITPTSYAFHVSDTPSAGVTSFKFAKLAKVQKKHVLVRDRARLVRILLIQGYLPSADGAFVNTALKPNRFPPQLWNRVGAEVEPVEGKRSYRFRNYYGDAFLVDPTWTEIVEVTDAE